MNPRLLIVAVLAVVSGLSAVFLVRGLSRPDGSPAVERVAVVFAKSDIRPGELIEAKMLETRLVPQDEVLDDAVREPAEAIDRAAQNQIDAGDLLRKRKLAEKGAGRGMAALIRPGMRAFTIQTPSFSSSLAGLIRPGNHVDVLLTMDRDPGTAGANGGGTTTTLLQNVEILAVHNTMNPLSSAKIDPNEARSVTLQVTPDQAARLDFGQNRGTLHLSLRNAKDDESPETNPITLADLPLPHLPPPDVAPEPAPGTQPALEPEPEPEPVMASAPAVAPPPKPEAEVVSFRTLRGTRAGTNRVYYEQAPELPAVEAAPPDDADAGPAPAPARAAAVAGPSRPKPSRRSRR